VLDILEARLRAAALRNDPFSATGEIEAMVVYDGPLGLLEPDTPVVGGILNANDED